MLVASAQNALLALENQAALLKFSHASRPFVTAEAAPQLLALALLMNAKLPVLIPPAPVRTAFRPTALSVLPTPAARNPRLAPLETALEMVARLRTASGPPLAPTLISAKNLA